MRVVIAEDSVLLRAGLTRLLVDAGDEVVAAVGDADELLVAVERHQPDLAIVDVRMPPTHTDEGLRAAVAIRASWPGVGDPRVLAVRRGALRHRAARGRHRRRRLPAQGPRRRRVASSSTRRAASPTAAPPSIPRWWPSCWPAAAGSDPLARLTPRERDVLGLMAEGRSNAAIARALVVSDGAVEKHVSNIFTKLDLPPTDHDHRRVLAVLRWLEA